jgi:hypothetical protein
MHLVLILPLGLHVTQFHHFLSIILFEPADKGHYVMMSCWFELWTFHKGQSHYTMSPESISTGAQYVTPDSKIYWDRVKMCRFISGTWFFLHQIRAFCHGW